MTGVRSAGSRTFRALHVRNFRLFFIGQIVSMSGTWMQSVALALLILSHRLHGNGVDVGAATALQFVPILLFGTLGGLVADRVDKRRLLIVTQVAAAVLAVLLAILTTTDAVRMWQVFVFSGVLGVVTLFTNPTRQSFVSEMVGRELLSNAVSLNSVLINSARVVGPAIGGVLILTVGFSACFFFNAASYIAVIVALALMRPAELHVTERVTRAKGQVRDGLRYVWTTPALRTPLVAVAIVGTLSFNFTTTLPLLAEYTFHGGAGTYSAFTSCMGGGAVIGGLYIAYRSLPSLGMLGGIGLMFGGFITAVAFSPVKAMALVALVLMGSGMIAFLATANSIVQLAADPQMRGRVMAVYATLLLGSTPIGAPLMGWISDTWSPRVALAVGAAAAIGASVPLALASLRRRSAAGAAAPGTPRIVTDGVTLAPGTSPVPAPSAAPVA